MLKKEAKVVHELVWFQDPAAKVVDVEVSGEVGVGDVPWKDVEEGVFFDHGVACCLVNCFYA